MPNHYHKEGLKERLITDVRVASRLRMGARE
jgi:hypothetical protein